MHCTFIELLNEWVILFALRKRKRRIHFRPIPDHYFGFFRHCAVFNHASCSRLMQPLMQPPRKSASLGLCPSSSFANTQWPLRLPQPLFSFLAAYLGFFVSQNRSRSIFSWCFKVWEPAATPLPSACLSQKKNWCTKLKDSFSWLLSLVQLLIIGLRSIILIILGFQL